MKGTVVMHPKELWVLSAMTIVPLPRGEAELDRPPSALTASPSHPLYGDLSGQGGLELRDQLPGAAGGAGPLHGVQVPGIPRSV